MSIQKKLARTLLGAIVGATLVLMSAVAFFGTSEFREANTIRLTHIGHLVLGLSTSLPKDVRPTPLIDPDIYNRLDLKDYLIVVRRGDSVIYAAPSLPGQDWPLFEGADTVDIGAERFDLVHVMDQRSATQVTVGVLSGEARKSVMEIVTATIVLFLAVALLLWLVTFRAIKSSLTPLHSFADDVETRHSGNLTPIDSDTVPAELTTVANSINGLMGKVDRAFQQERQFVSNAAHELRSPIAGILAQLDRVQLRGAPQEVEDSLAKVRNAAERSSRMISQLLDHARATSIEDDIAVTTRFDLVQFVAEIVSERVQSAVDQGVDLGLQCQVAHATITQPKELLQIIIENLIDNAVKYSASSGVVNVTVQLAEDHIQLCIEDNGPGLSEEMFAKACRRFERFSGAQGDGYGLGLALVAELCDRLQIQMTPFRAASLGGLGVRLDIATTPAGA